MAKKCSKESSKGALKRLPFGEVVGDHSFHHFICAIWGSRFGTIFEMSWNPFGAECRLRSLRANSEAPASPHKEVPLTNLILGLDLTPKWTPKERFWILGRDLGPIFAGTLPDLNHHPSSL